MPLEARVGFAAMDRRLVPGKMLKQMGGMANMFTSAEHPPPEVAAIKGRSALLEQLDEKALDRLKEEFLRRGGTRGVDRGQFLACVRAIWPGGLDRQRIGSLQHVFDENDLDGVGLLRWDQFSSYYCDIAAASQSGQRSDLYGYSYRQKPLLTEEMFKRTRIAKVHYVDALAALLVVEVGSGSISVFWGDAAGALRPSGETERWTPFEGEGEGGVEAVHYVAPRKQLAVARSTGPFGVFDVKMTKVNPLKRVDYLAPDERVDPARDFAYGEDSDCLFAFAPTTGALQTWSMDERRLLSVYSPHAGGILGALALDGPNLLVTAGQDKRLLVHDLGELLDGGDGIPSLKVELGGSRLDHAIRTLDYSDDYGLLLSGSYECEANCWDPNVGGRIGLQMRLVGHRSPLVALAVAKLPSNSHKRGTRDAAVTLDTEGVFRLWDLDRSHCTYDHQGSVALCLHSFRVASSVDEVVRPKHVCSSWGRGRTLVAATKHRAYFFEAVLGGDAAGICANEAPVACAYAPWTAQFVLRRGGETRGSTSLEYPSKRTSREQSRVGSLVERSLVER